ncbi:MAG: hemerythrin family protein, partial [Rhodocyclaceae bacterium]|nr:hemerythrin family protein [Rhodocyclaceae bacterium]
LLESAAYPALDAQKAEHESYLAKLSELLLAATQANYDRADLDSYLRKWWTAHILESDMQYKDTLAQQRAKAQFTIGNRM